MADIIKFEKPQEKSVEDRLLNTLNLEQIDMFLEIMMKAGIDQEQREMKLIKRICELEDEIIKLKKNKKKPYIKLKPCICGCNRRTTIYSYGGYFFECKKCHYKSNKYTLKSALIKGWNDEIETQKGEQR